MPVTAPALPHRWRLFGIVAGITLVLDQVTKILARSALEAGESVPVIDGFWDWHLAYNTGAAFSMFGDAAFGRILLTAVAFLAVGIIVYMARSAINRRSLLSLAAILGGTVGNLIDRVAFGHVTDFVFWHWHEHPWPIFNVADVALVVGIGILLIDMFAARKTEPAERAADPS